MKEKQLLNWLLVNIYSYFGWLVLRLLVQSSYVVQDGDSFLVLLLQWYGSYVLAGRHGKAFLIPSTQVMC